MSVRHSRYLPLFVFINDVFLLNLSLVTAHFLVFHNLTPSKPSSLLFLMINVFWSITTQATKSFEIKRPLILNENINKFLLTIIYSLMLLFGAIYFFAIVHISRMQVVLCFSMFSILIIFQRSAIFFFLDYFRKRGYNHRQVMFIGNNDIVIRLMKSFNQHPEYGYDLNDFISEQQVAALSSKELKRKILTKSPDELFICYEHINPDFIQQMVEFGNEHMIKINVVPGITFANDYNHVKLISYDNVPVLRISSDPEISYKIRVLKRSFDLAFSSTVMVAGLPVFLILYVITKATSKGPVFYKQERIGRNNKPFYIYKFRSMYVGAESVGPQLSSGDNDPRITKWGRKMRKTRLDELPQFWNVLKGEMSVVGPRPERQFYIEKILEKTPNYKKLSCLKPGLTSIGQVHYGYAESVEEMCTRLRYDLVYLNNLNLNSDVDIILRTVKVMMQRKGK